MGRAVAEGADKSFALLAETLGGLLGGCLDRVLQLLAAIGEPIDERPGVFVEDTGDLGGACRQACR